MNCVSTPVLQGTADHFDGDQQITLQFVIYQRVAPASAFLEERAGSAAARRLWDNRRKSALAGVW